MRYALALDLVDDSAMIQAYEQAHEKIWPAVRDHLREQGVLQMEIYRVGNRLFMLMDVDGAVYSHERMALAAQRNADVVRWEALMGTYQVPTPWASSGEKWVLMQRIFDLAAQ